MEIRSKKEPRVKINQQNPFKESPHGTSYHAFQEGWEGFDRILPSMRPSVEPKEKDQREKWLKGFKARVDFEIKRIEDSRRPPEPIVETIGETKPAPKKPPRKRALEKKAS